ncbi:DNA methyltransferase [Actinomadura decatromicini]|uniref:Methyltransferase n=1 Tax=Actinomadura decatromicini TaxID=2604572 RepID=A0A5D3FT33_9ACTN|nr:DNA methyltransferase [Actinomadura decatromicini]TYK51076.1 site-specific DNA-methyltransferase [Actinomadura decatromicini]
MSTEAADWTEDAFFEVPERDSIDGGTTTEGPLWHVVSPRWGHSMHTMCSYHGMFPAKLVHHFIQQYSRPGDVVFDPFSGRGTVPLQARVEGRRTISNDLSPLAYVLSLAKASPPSWTAINKYLDDLEKRYRSTTHEEPDVSPDIKMLYNDNTLRQICYIRNQLHSRKMANWSPEMAMIAGSLAGIMHGSHRRDGTSQYLSISMPNTFSMSPTYVAKFIEEKRLVPPDQDVFERLRDKISRLYLDAIDGFDGQVFASDASKVMGGRQIPSGSVDLLVTSPPYLQVVNYGTANWIRLWLLGVEEVGRERGKGRVELDAALDHRHTYKSYQDFLLRTLRGIRRVLKQDGVAALVIGDVADPGKEPIPLAKKVWDDIGEKTGLRLLSLIDDYLPVEKKVSRIWGDTKGQATNRDCVLVLAHQNGRPWVRSDVIDWDEPYKDGGPDAAHLRVKARLSNNAGPGLEE